MHKSPDNLTSYDFLSLVPAGGFGSRLGCLTTEQAKPSLAVSFTDDGEVIRMIDIPLKAIRGMGGAALVSTFYAPHSLDFVNEYPSVKTCRDRGPCTPIDTLLANLALLQSSDASVIGIVPGDTYITASMLEGMRTALEKSGADAAILSTRKLDGHNVRNVDNYSIATTQEGACDKVADLGVHFMRRDWLLANLARYDPDQINLSVDIWNDLYTIEDPSATILMHVPEDDPEHVDMGTPASFHKLVTQLNKVRADGNENVVFPYARISGRSVRTIALPQSSSTCDLNRAVVPEGKNVCSESETLKGEQAA